MPYAPWEGFKMLKKAKEKLYANGNSIDIEFFIFCFLGIPSFTSSFPEELGAGEGF